MKTITNECGTFWVEDDGTLQYYECAPENFGKDKPTYANEDYDPETHIVRLDIPEGITRLQTDCDFYRYTIEEVTFPKSLRIMEDAVFDRCVIGNLVIPEGVEEYHRCAFDQTQIQRLVIPDSVTTAQIDRFIGISPWYNVLPIISPFERVSHLPISQLPLWKLTSISGTFGVDADGVLRKFECAEENFYFPLQEPSYRNEKHINWLDIPEGVTALPSGAFDGYTVVTSVTLPETLVVLGDASGGVFRYGSYSHTLELPKGITFVAEDSFFLSTFGTVRLSDEMDPQTVQRLVQLFRNHTYHSFLFHPVVTIRDFPPLRMPAADSEGDISMKKITNESGTFYVDRLGVLQSFCCSEDNNADACNPRDTKKVYNLHIPEGVTVLKEDAFRYYTVLDKLTLPNSLRLMGTGHGCVFANSHLPDVVLPERLEILGDFSFGVSTMRSLRLPPNAVWEYARQFKESSIETLYISQKYKDEADGSKLRQHLNPGHIHSIVVNNVRIGKIVWLE